MLVAGAAEAAPPARQRMVAVVRPVGAEAEAREVATRIIAELMANEIPIVAISCDTLDAACATPADRNVAATVLIAGTSRFPTVAVFGPSREGKPQRIDVVFKGAASPTALAVRTMEVLRVLLLEPVAAEVAPAPSSSAAPPGRAPPPRPVAEPPPRESPKTADEEEEVVEPVERIPFAWTRRAVRFGPTWFGSVSGLVSSFGAAVSLIAPTSRHLQFSVFLAGGAFGRDERTVDGVASIKQALGVAQMEWHGVVGSRLGLSGGLGFGLHYFQVDGQVLGVNPLGPGTVLSPLTSRRFSPAFSGSLGATVAVGRQLALFLEGRVYFLTQIPVVQVNSVEVGRTGDPGLSLTAGVEFRL
jgi:hypothetical protein